MPLASALSVLCPTLPYYLALTKFDLLHLDATTFEFRPNRAAPPLALEMAKAVFTMGASSCIESYVVSRMLSEGPKVFAFDALTCEAVDCLMPENGGLQWPVGGVFPSTSRLPCGVGCDLLSESW